MLANSVFFLEEIKTLFLVNKNLRNTDQIYCWSLDGYCHFSGNNLYVWCWNLVVSAIWEVLVVNVFLGLLTQWSAFFNIGPLQTSDRRFLFAGHWSVLVTLFFWMGKAKFGIREFTDQTTSCSPPQTKWRTGRKNQLALPLYCTDFILGMDSPWRKMTFFRENMSEMTTPCDNYRLFLKSAASSFIVRLQSWYSWSLEEDYL